MPDRRVVFIKIRDIADSLRLSDKVSEGAADLVAAYLDYGPEDPPKEPVMAVSALYMSSIMWERPVSRKAFSACVGVSPGTISRSYRKMAKILFPNIGECCRRVGEEGGRMPGPPSG